MTESPKPAPYFAMRVLRAMTKTCATHAIGLDGFALVALVASQWDTVRYAYAPTFHRDNLMNLLGIRHQTEFYRLEKRCLESGWLCKNVIGRRRPSVYWVAIPDQHSEVSDTPSIDDVSETSVCQSVNPTVYPSCVPITDEPSSVHKTVGEVCTNVCAKVCAPSVLSLSLRPLEEKDPTQDLFGAKPATPEPPPSDEQDIRTASLHVRWRTKDPEQSEENRTFLLWAYRLKRGEFLRTAERLCLAGGEKVFAEDVMRELAEQAPVPTPPPTPPREVHPTHHLAVRVAKTMALAQLHDVLGRSNFDRLDVPTLMEDPGHAARVIAWDEKRRQGAA